MLGLTSIDLPFLGNLRSNWVVIIGLDLLSLTCPGYCYGYVDPISVENRIWGDGNGICGCDADGSRLVRCNAGSLWIVMIPKSNDQFME
jgi:hypothetical protein